VPILDEGFRRIAVITFARQVVANEDRLSGRTREVETTVHDGQLALQRLAEEIYPQLLNQVSKVRESGPVTDAIQQILDVGIPDLGESIATSRKQLDATTDSFGLDYTVVLGEIISRIEQYSIEISNEVAGDVFANVTREAMRNGGPQ
jgi:hypothetical protein